MAILDGALVSEPEQVLEPSTKIKLNLSMAQLRQHKLPFQSTAKESAAWTEKRRQEPIVNHKVNTIKGFLKKVSTSISSLWILEQHIDLIKGQELL